MRGTDKYCITVSGTTNEEMWLEIADVLGPTGITASGTTSSGILELMASDIADYNTWTSSYGLVPFDKWLIWKYRVGTDRYGNLPENKKNVDKVGHSWCPCPYSTQSSDLRTRHLLGLGDLDPLPIKIDHTLSSTTYYMKTVSRGARWGYECSFPGCTHFILNGEKYFYV